MNCSCDIKTKGFHDWLIKRLSNSDSIKLESLRLFGILPTSALVSNSAMQNTLSIIKVHFPEEYDNLIKLLILK